MKFTKIAASSAAILLSTSAFAGGIDRSGQSITALFDEGRVFTFSYGYVQPSVEGTAFGTETDNMAPSYHLPSFSYKADYGSNFSYALIVDSPFGAGVEYTQGAPRGLEASVDSLAVTALAQYNFGGFSIFGGPRFQRVEGGIRNPAGYKMDFDQIWGYGYTVGAAYEIPEYAFRASLSYNSEITYDATFTEATALGTVSNEAEQTTPQSVNFEFQTGLNQNTLLFGSVRWVDWSEFNITAPVGGEILSYDDDVITYNIGIGYKINDSFSIAGSIGYEAAQESGVSLLDPTDGYVSYGLAGIYKLGNTKLTAGVRYVDLGDAADAAVGHDFKDNSALGFGLSISHSF